MIDLENDCSFVREMLKSNNTVLRGRILDLAAQELFEKKKKKLLYRHFVINFLFLRRYV